MSRIAFSGARTRKFSRCPSGFKNVWIVTSFGISCAGTVVEATTRRKARARRNVMRRVPGFYLPACRPCEYTGRRVDPPRSGRGGRKDGAVKRNFLIGATFVAAIIGLGITERALEQTAQAQAKAGGQVPIFQVDPFWPKDMGNMVFGQTIGLGVDEKDQVWIIHRGNDPTNLDGTEYATPPANAKEYYRPGATKVSECCDPAPPVVAFD